MATVPTMPQRAISMVQASFCVIGAFHRISTIHYIHIFTELSELTRFDRIHLFRHSISPYKHPSDYCPAAVVPCSFVLVSHVRMIKYNEPCRSINSIRANCHTLFNMNVLSWEHDLVEVEYTFTFDAHKPL